LTKDIRRKATTDGELVLNGKISDVNYNSPEEESDTESSSET